MVQLQSSSNSKLHKVCWEIEQRVFFLSLLTGQFTDKSYTMLWVLSFIYVKACTPQHVSRAFFLIYISPKVQPWWWRHGEIWMRFFMAKHCILFMGDLSVKSILSINTLTRSSQIRHQAEIKPFPFDSHISIKRWILPRVISISRRKLDTE